MKKFTIFLLLFLFIVWSNTAHATEVSEQPAPIVLSTSSTSYECGEDTQKTTTITITTDYVLNENGEWVLGEPVEESTETEQKVRVVPCKEPAIKVAPICPPGFPKAKVQVVAVPTVVNSGL